jgi:hypothetical protein
LVFKLPLKRGDWDNLDAQGRADGLNADAWRLPLLLTGRMRISTRMKQCINKVELFVLFCRGFLNDENLLSFLIGRSIISID